MLCLVTHLCLTLCDPVDCSLLGSSVHEDSPGKNTGVVCHALLQGIFPTQGLKPGHLHCKWILYHLRYQGSPLYIYVSCVLSRSVVSDSLLCHGLQPTRLLCPWGFSKQDTGVGSLSLLQGIFPTQESNQGLLNCRRILYQLSYQGSPLYIYVVSRSVVSNSLGPHGL